MNERSVEEIDAILQLAKLSIEDVLPTSQVISFTSNNLCNNNYKLLELDSHLLGTIKEGNLLFIKGSSDENVTLCSGTRTYDVLETETSNSLLLVQDLQFKDKLEIVNERSISKVIVAGMFYDYLEPNPSRPYLQKLHNMLSKAVYKGPEFESEVNENDLFTYEQILDSVQSSKGELDDVLESLHVFKIDNKIRTLSFEYHFRILSYMLKLVEENSWNLSEIDYDETINTLNNLAPITVLDTLFDMYTEKSKVVDGLQLYRYKEVDVCRFLAQVLLSDAGRFSFTEFFQAWTESVPEGMVPNEEMLYGIAVIDKSAIPYTVKSFSENNLPDGITDRLRVLFEVKAKWTVPEISPYIQSMTIDKMDVNALLAKHARASTMGGVKYYSSKHGK